MTLADVGRELGNAGIGAQRSKGLSEKWKRLYCNKLRMAAIRNACALQSNFLRIVAHNRVRRSDKASNRRGGRGCFFAPAFPPRRGKCVYALRPGGEVDMISGVKGYYVMLRMP